MVRVHQDQTAIKIPVDQIPVDPVITSSVEHGSTHVSITFVCVGVCVSASERGTCIPEPPVGRGIRDGN